MGELSLDKWWNSYLNLSTSFGLLHRIPAQSPDHIPGSTPPELLAEEDDYHEEQLFVPADVHSESELIKITEWRQDWNRQTPTSHLLHSENSDQETAMPGSETPERYQIDEEEEEEEEHSSPQETPRRPPMAHVSFKRTPSSLNGTFNGD